MIVINSGKLIIPEEERFIGYAGDNLHSQKQFLVTNADDENCIYRLYLTFDDGKVNFLVLDKTISQSSTTLLWNIKEEDILKSGIVNAQIKAFSDNGEIYHTSSDYFYVAPAAEFSDEFCEKENAEFLRYEKTLNDILEKIESGSLDLVPQSRTIAGVNLVSDITADGLRSALKTYPVKALSSIPGESTSGKPGQFCYKVTYIVETQTYKVDLYLCVSADATNGVYKWVLVNSGTLSDEQIASALADYLEKNPLPDSGADGEDGVGVSKAELNSNGELVLTYTDGKADNVGKVVGEDGAKGDKGDKGDTGETGPQGEKGADGKDGADGFSPSISVTEVDTGYKLSITKTADGSIVDTVTIKHGETPVKGVDYFTESDKAQFVSEVKSDEELGGKIDEMYDVLTPLFEQSLNIFNKNDVAYDKCRYYAIGRNMSETTSRSGYAMGNQLFSCKAGDVIRSSHAWTVEIIVYNESGVSVENSNFDGTKTYTIASDSAKYFAIQTSSHSVVEDLMITKNNEMPSVYTQYTEVVTIEQISKNKADIEKLKSNTVEFKPFVALSFDAFDLSDNRFNIVYGEYGYKATVAHRTADSAQVNKTVLKAGWDVGLYKLDGNPAYSGEFSYDDAVSATPSDEVLSAWEAYVKSAVDEAELAHVFNPVVWLCRQGCSCCGLEKALEKYKIPMCRGSYNPDYSNDWDYSSDKLPTLTVAPKNTLMPSTLESCMSAIDEAVNSGVGIAFITHGIYSTDDDANSNYGITETALKSFLDKVKTYVDSGELEVVTYRDIYEKYYPEKAKEYDYNRLLKTALSSL